ncbi:hypothetical protein RJ641_016658, partial [Dillenia turbinata]
MGGHEGWAQPSGLLPNGLLPNEGPSVIRILDPERWMKAEERTAQLIACIQPNQPSEERRNAVADYVQRLIAKCFPCQVFTFGSVPLKTYLPDGDIDVTAFSKNQNLKDTWANLVRDMLESEEKNENAKFHVKEVQYIQAEVKIIKCLVENIVVDISFNQLGGLCTLCFLEEVDDLINHDHLFKRSIILIKAWCYYESRILGAHHGLISTYALETLVLYIFHVFNNSFAGPLEVLYRFLEFFSNFDWDNFCVSLWGPVPISSLPDVTAEPPRRDGGELLLSKSFLDACSSVYAVFPGGQEIQGQPFVSKHFNVIDPLRTNNNLGRSVSKGNFFRIRSAFAFGAKRLARLLDCPEENLVFEVNQFFMNTWDRHGSGLRPDAPRLDLRRSQLPSSDQLHGSESLETISGNKKLHENYSHENDVERPQGSHNMSLQYGSNPSGSTSKTNVVSAASRTQSLKAYVNLNNSRTPDQIARDVGPNQDSHTDKNQKSCNPERLLNDIQGKYHFARTHSSPELTDTYGDASSKGRRSRAPENGQGQTSSARLDYGSRKNLGSENLTNHGARPSGDDPSSVRFMPPHQSLDTLADLNSATNNYVEHSNLSPMAEEHASTMGTMGMQQEEQDLVNMMASSTVHNFNGQIHMPVNLASGHLPLPMSPSILASMGYAQRNLAGVIPANFPLIEPPWNSNLQFPQGLVSTPLAHYFPGISLTSSPEDLVESGNENFGSAELNQQETNHDYWHEQDGGSTGGFDPDNGAIDMLQSDDRPNSSSEGYDYVTSSRLSASFGSGRGHLKSAKENHSSAQEELVDSFQYHDNRGIDVYSNDRSASSRFSPSHATLKSKTPSESSWEGPSMKASKSTREKRGRKAAPSAESSSMYGKGKNVSDYASSQAEDDIRDWGSVSTMGTEITEISTGPPSVAPLHIPRHQLPGFEPAQTSGSDSLIPIAPMLLGPGSRQRALDNSGVLPFAFYPTGPPVPFLTMLPVYNFSNESGTDAGAGHFGGEGPGKSDSGQNFDSAEGLEQSEASNAPSSVGRAGSIEPLEDHKADILHSDFASHWQNLQYGRFCQNPRFHGPVFYPSPVVVPPGYLQGRFPWDGPGRPLSGNMNLFTQLMSYGPRLVPVAPLQSVSNRSTGVYQRYGDEMPRYRGTGTYLPNPKISVKDRHSSSSRRGNYSYDRGDHNGDRDGNWNANSKSRAVGRSHSRNQVEKPSSRQDRLPASESRSDRQWGSQRHDNFASYQSQNGPLRSNPSQNNSANVAYGMYPIPALNSNDMSSNGPTVPSVVMLYPYDHNAAYGSPADHLEFGSFGPVGFSGTNEVSQISEGNRARGAFEEQRFHGSSTQRSSPDQPSSPHFQRSVSQRNYQLKDEDFPPLKFQNNRDNDVFIGLFKAVLECRLAEF